MIDILIPDRVDIARTSLQKQGHCVGTEVVFNDSRRETDDIRGNAAGRYPLNRMAGKVVDHSQRPAVFSIETQQTDLWIDRSDRSHLGIGRQRVSVSHICLPTIFQTQATILHDAIFVPDATTDSDRLEILTRIAHRLNGPLGHVRADNSVAMAGVNHHAFRRNAAIGRQLMPDLRQKVVGNVANLAERHRVDCDERNSLRVVFQYQGFGVQAVVNRSRLLMRDIRFSDSRPQDSGGLRRGNTADPAKCTDNEGDRQGGPGQLFLMRHDRTPPADHCSPPKSG